MRKCIAFTLVLVLAIAISGCSGINLDETVDLDGYATYQVSSKWPDMPTGIIPLGADDSQVDAGAVGTARSYRVLDSAVNVILYKDMALDADDAHAIGTASMKTEADYSDFEDISREESTVDDAKCVVFEYSSSHRALGERKWKDAFVTKDGFTIRVSYTAPSGDYDSKYFDAVLGSLRVTK
jgi:hypothetical protein